jgi:hypothetical protein
MCSRKEKGPRDVCNDPMTRRRSTSEVVGEVFDRLKLVLITGFGTRAEKEGNGKARVAARDRGLRNTAPDTAYSFSRSWDLMFVRKKKVKVRH